MDNIKKFKINGIVADLKSEKVEAANGNTFILKKILVEQEEINGNYVRKDVFEIIMDFEEHNVMKGDTVEITGIIRSNPSKKDKTKHYISLTGTNLLVTRRPNAKYQAYRDEQPEQNLCLNNKDNEECPF